MKTGPPAPDPHFTFQHEHTEDEQRIRWCRWRCHCGAVGKWGPHRMLREAWLRHVAANR